MDALLEALSRRTRRLAIDDRLDDLVERIGDARVVLMGEASHGTSEYYLWRARLSRRLIEEKGFSFVGVEGDWPDCYQVNRYAKTYDGTPGHASEVLGAFDRWPTWMWANWEVVSFIEWLRVHNRDLEEPQKAGFYGLDVYSLWESLEAVLDHVTRHHPTQISRVRTALACLHPYDREPQNYAMAIRYISEDCEDEIIEVMRALQDRRSEVPEDPESHFSAEQNALAAIGAERYYRAMVRNDDVSWNIRDTHMADTLDRLLERHGPNATGIVWEHNPHVGDARATDMAEAGMVNIGQLARDRYGRDNCFIVGFSGYEGSVIAGDYWGAPMEVMTVPPARENSWEHLIREADGSDQLVFTRDLRDLPELRRRRGHRAIGVVYDPARERFGNFVPTDLVDRYDALIALQNTQALHPLHLHPSDMVEPPATYPYAL